MSTISGVSSNLIPLIQSALDINNQLTDLSRQLGTGQKADTYSGLGPQSGIAMALSAQLTAIGSYDDTISTVQTNISLQQSVLQQIDSIGGSTKAMIAGQPTFDIDRERPGRVETRNCQSQMKTTRLRSRLRFVLTRQVASARQAIKITIGKL